GRPRHRPARAGPDPATRPGRRPGPGAWGRCRTRPRSAVPGWHVPSRPRGGRPAPRPDRRLRSPPPPARTRRRDGWRGGRCRRPAHPGRSGAASPPRPRPAARPRLRPGRRVAWVVDRGTAAPATPPLPRHRAIRPAAYPPARPAMVPPLVVRPAVVRPAVVRPAVVRPAVVRPAVVRPAVVRPAVVRPAVVRP